LKYLILALCVTWSVADDPFFHVNFDDDWHAHSATVRCCFCNGC
jgi:hypothetical protein